MAKHSLGKKRPAFTLVEFILYFGLIGLVLTGVIGFALDYMRSYNKAVIISRVEQETRFGMLRILRSVRQAAKLNVGSSTFNDDAGVLSLDAVAASNTPTIFDLSAGALRIKEGAAAAAPLTTGEVNVQKLRFSKDNLGGNNNAVTVEMTVSYMSVNPDKLLSYVVSASGTAVIRKD